MPSQRSLKRILRGAIPALVVLGAASLAIFGGVGTPANPASESYSLETYACSGGSGQFDETGRTYVPCNDGVRILAPDGSLERTVAATGLSDIAPAPDGSWFVGSTWGSTPVKYLRQADGTYTKDAAFTMQKFMYAGAERTVRASRIATDARGDIYISSGYWAGDLGVVLKYRPDGTFVTLFGAYTDGDAAKDVNGDGVKGDDPLLWQQGRFYWNVAGLAVTRDGRYVYTSEVGNNRVQRWEYQLDGTYKSTKMWGNSAATDPQRKGSCTKGLMAAPYDLGLDPWGFVYVANATCTQVQKFDGDGTWAFSMWVGTNGPTATGPGRAHYIAVDGHGNVLSSETNRRMRRTSPEPGAWPEVQPLPVPDVTAPTLTSITLPATTSTATIDVTIAATDNVGVTGMRTANENGDWSPWRPFATPAAHTLSAGYGVKGVFVQVRDAAGLESGVIYKTLSYAKADPGPNPDPPPPGPDAAPTITAVTVPATSTTRSVEVVTTATDDKGLQAIRFATEDGNWQEWRTPYAARTTFDLSAGLGIKGVFVQVRDTAGQTSNTMYRTLTVVQGNQPPPPDEPPPPAADAPPTLTGLTLPAVTPTQLVALSVAARDDVAVTEMRFANEDGTWGAWRPYVADTQHLLTAGRLTKGVFVQVRDAGKRESNTVFKTTLCDPCMAPAQMGNARLVREAAKVAKRARRLVGTRRADKLTARRGFMNIDASIRDSKRDVITCAAGPTTVLMRPEDVTRRCGRNDRVSVVREPSGTYGR